MSALVPVGNAREIGFAGGGRGYQGILRALADLNSASENDFRANVYDIKPGVAKRAAQAARAVGLTATSQEVDVRTLPNLDRTHLLLVQTDDGAANAQVFLQQPDVDKLGFLVVADSSDRLFTLMADVPAKDDVAAIRAAALFTSFGRNAVVGSSADVWGRPPFGSQQPIIRNLISREFTTTLERKVSGLPTSPGLRISFDGKTSHRTFIFDRQNGFGNPATDAYDILSRADVPIRPDETVVLAEVGRDAEIRLHRVRRRLIDRVVLVEGIPVIDPRGLRPTDGARYEQARHERALLLAIAERNAVTRRQPVRTTD